MSLILYGGGGYFLYPQMPNCTLWTVPVCPIVHLLMVSLVNA